MKSILAGIMCLSMLIVFGLFLYIIITKNYDRKYVAAMWICNIIYWTSMGIKNII